MRLRKTHNAGSVIVAAISMCFVIGCNEATRSTNEITVKEQTNAAAIQPTDIGVTNITKSKTEITSSVEWRTYSNPKYGFSVRYPCDGKCTSSPPRTYYDGAHTEERITFPTTDNSIQVGITLFSDESVASWKNKLIEDEKNHEEVHGEPFPYSLKILREILKGNIGQKCISFNSPHNDSEMLYGFESCDIVAVGGAKAIKLVSDGSGRVYPMIILFIPRSDNLWMGIYITYALESERPKTETGKIAKAAMDVLNTLEFTK